MGKKRVLCQKEQLGNKKVLFERGSCYWGKHMGQGDLQSSLRKGRNSGQLEDWAVAWPSRSATSTRPQGLGQPVLPLAGSLSKCPQGRESGPLLIPHCSLLPPCHAQAGWLHVHSPSRLTHLPIDTDFHHFGCWKCVPKEREKSQHKPGWWILQDLGGGLISCSLPPSDLHIFSQKHHREP